MGIVSRLVSASIVLALPVGVASAHVPSGPGQHFFKAGSTSTWSGYGQINDNICDAVAVVTVGPGHGSGPHADHADYATVEFTNTDAACNAYSVSAVIYPNGDASNVVVKYLGTPICASTGVFTGAVTYVGNITSAYTNYPLTAGACTLLTGISLNSTSDAGSPSKAD